MGLSSQFDLWLMLKKCDKCGRIIGQDKDTPVFGPLEGKSEYLCRRCYNFEELIGPVKWKRS
jgi:hypothetical protein